MTDLQETLCQMAEDNYEQKIEEIMSLDIIGISDGWVAVKDPQHGTLYITVEQLI